MTAIWYSTIKALLVSAAIPIGFSIGFFICACILSVLKVESQT